MLVREVMTRKVITVEEDTPLKDVAAVMLQHRISGLPVVDGDRVIGVVSETDVLFKERGASFRRPGILRRWRNPLSASGCRKATARTAAEAMTTPAISVPARASVADAAALMPSSIASIVCRWSKKDVYVSFEMTCSCERYGNRRTASASTSAAVKFSCVARSRPNSTPRRSLRSPTAFLESSPSNRA